MRKSITKINGSQTFFFKSRCKHCKSGPKYIYFMLNKQVSPKNFFKLRDFYEKSISSYRADDFYIDYAIRNRNFAPSYMFDGTTSAYRKLPVPNFKYQQNEDKFVTVIECDCGKTSWAYVKSNRHHIINRKSSVSYDTKEIMTLYRILI